MPGRGGIDGVVNLAAGLDARPYRLQLPRTLRWIEVDLPAMVKEKGDARLNCTMPRMWTFHVWKRLAPRRTARMIAKWRAAVALLERD